RVSGSETRQLAGCPAALSHALVLATLPGGGVWLGGEQPTIRWRKGAGVMTVDLQRSDDSGGHWRTLARGLIGTSYLYTATPPWTSPASLPAGTRCGSSRGRSSGLGSTWCGSRTRAPCAR